MKQIARRLVFAAAFFLLVLPAFSQINERKESVWDTTFGTLTLIQEGPFVWGTYNYHGGKVVGAMRDGKLYGFWWEDDDTTGVGPGGEWCGPFVLAFDGGLSAFKGNYGKHSRGESNFWKMDPTRIWEGTRKSGSIAPYGW